MKEQIEMLILIEEEERRRKAEIMKHHSTMIEYYQKRPYEYMVERLHIKPETLDWELNPEYNEHKWDGTRNPLKTTLDSLVTERRIGVESATGTGKTFLAAGIVLWFLECFHNARVVTTAPKEDQLLSQIWSEISGLYPRFGLGELLSGELRMLPDPNTKYKAEAFVAGVKADEASTTKAQGYHAEHMLIILEETPGIPAPTITALLNTSDAPHNIVLAFGNPDHQLDNLHKFCTTPGTKHIRISALDHPNIVLNNPSFIPGATSKVGIQDKLIRYGSELNPFYLSRVRGISPAQGQDSLIQLDWCYEAVKRKYEEVQDGEGALGVDVANSEAGDKAAIAYGHGCILEYVKDFQCPDANQLGKRDVFALMNEKNISQYRVGVDGVGVGAGTINALKEIGKDVVNLNGGYAPMNVEDNEYKFNNLRSQMYWQLREDLRLGKIILPKDEELFADLITPKWETKSGKIIVESKEGIKKRLGHSPNKGDAVVYWNWIREDREGGFSFLR